MKNMIKKIIKRLFFKQTDNRFQILERQLQTLEHQNLIIKTLLKQAIKMTTGVDFYGQVNQDMIAYMFFGGKKEGFFVDVGANDGKTINNTLIFEKLGWQGICVEPLPDIFNKLRANRHCDCYNVAIFDISEKNLEFDRVIGADMLSVLSSQMTDAHKNHITYEKGKIEKIFVKTLTFSDLMKNYPDRKHIDFLSLDAEGAEIPILKTIDFDYFSFGLITVEDNDGGNTLENFMKERGYKVYLKLGLDTMFVPNSFSSNYYIYL
ncbi:MAG: FkbM family methyltransferase [Spirochaetes bacterium]|nr:FkbM family methyltransferase [Spirochaetota bacterium]